MSTYLPKDSGVGGVYTEGGGLFALGNVASHSCCIRWSSDAVVVLF